MKSTILKREALSQCSAPILNRTPQYLKEVPGGVPVTNPRTNDPDRIKISNVTEQRRRWSPSEKARIVEETQSSGMSVSAEGRLYEMRSLQTFCSGGENSCRTEAFRRSRPMSRS